MSSFIRVQAAGIDRNMLKGMLSQSRQGRIGQLLLTTETRGFYLAIVEHPDTAVIFQVALTALSISYQEIDGAEVARMNIRLLSSASTRPNPLRDQLLRDPEVVAAAKRALLGMLDPKSNSTFGGARLGA